MLNLYNYIVEGDFLSDLIKKGGTYTIVSDMLFESPSKSILVYSFEQVVKKSLSLEGTVICIAKHLTTKDSVSIDALIKVPHHRISINPGVMSMITKNMPEENDITTMLSQGYQVREPYAKSQLINLITKDTPSYLRIYDTPLAESIGKKGASQESIKLFGESSGNLTILCGVSHSDKVASAIHHISGGSMNIFDLHIWSHMSSKLQTDIINDIQESKRVLVILDHKATEEIWFYISALIQKHCGKGIELHCLFPQYHIVQSILPEYIYEESLFAEDNIMNFIESILHSIEAQK